jgi:hypothetical protein
MRKLLYLFFVYFLLFFLSQNKIAAQHLSIGDPFEEYLRLLVTDENIDDLPSFNIRPIYAEGNFQNYQSHPWQKHPFFQDVENNERFDFHLYSPTMSTTFNSHLPVGQNDSALWQGKGLNTLLSGGFTAKYSFLSTSIKPQFVFSQNRSFELSEFPSRTDFSEYAPPSYSGAYIDQPQRFGDQSISRIYPGQSWIRIEYRGAAAGLSSENIWSGPAIENPIVFSNNGPGIVHAFIGTYKPIKTAIGNFEGRILGGQLHESNFFDTNPDNDKRFINAILLNYSPSFIPGLHLGGTRMIQKYYPENGPSISDFSEVFQPFLKDKLKSDKNPRGNLGSHQLVSLFARWNFTEFGMEVYTEWSRNDHAGNLQDLLRHFEHARAYVLGFTKNFHLSNSRWLTTNVEITQLEVPRLDEFRRTGSYYNNGEVIQGFSNYGQVLGAGIGPGSNNQMLNLRYFFPEGMWGVSLNRIVHNNDRLYRLYNRQLLDNEPENLHFVELRLGIHGLRFFSSKNFEIQADLFWSHFLNYDYQFKNDRNNLNLGVHFRYFLPNMLR